MTRVEQELTCKELVEVITDYLEGMMPPAERERFDAHLAECPWCVTYLEQMRLTIRTLGSLTEESFPAGAKEDLLGIFRSWKSSGPSGSTGSG